MLGGVPIAVDEAVGEGQAVVLVERHDLVGVMDGDGVVVVTRCVGKAFDEPLSLPGMFEVRPLVGDLRELLDVVEDVGGRRRDRFQMRAQLFESVGSGART